MPGAWFVRGLLIPVSSNLQRFLFHAPRKLKGGINNQAVLHYFPQHFLVNLADLKDYPYLIVRLHRIYANIRKPHHFNQKL